jgi:hypothetical protein
MPLTLQLLPVTFFSVLQYVLLVLPLTRLSPYSMTSRAYR